MKSRLPEGRAWNNPFHKRKLFPWSFLCFSDSQVLQGWLSREPANGLLCCSDRQSSAATGVCLLNSRGPRDAREGSGTGAVKSDAGHPTVPGTFSPLTSQAGPNSGSCSSLPLPHSPPPPPLPLPSPSPAHPKPGWLCPAHGRTKRPRCQVCSKEGLLAGQPHRETGRETSNQAQLRLLMG